MTGIPSPHAPNLWGDSSPSGEGWQFPAVDTGGAKGPGPHVATCCWWVLGCERQSAEPQPRHRLAALRGQTTKPCHAFSTYLPQWALRKCSVHLGEGQGL